MPTTRTCTATPFCCCSSGGGSKVGLAKRRRSSEACPFASATKHAAPHLVSRHHARKCRPPPPRFSRKWRAQHSNHPFSLKEDLGWRGMVVAYLFCGVCANMASLLLLPGNTISLGASGAVFGRFGPSTTAPSPRFLESLRARFHLPSSTPPHRNKLPKLDTTTSNPPPSSHKASSPSRCSPG